MSKMRVFFLGWFWVVFTGALFQLWLLPLTPWHAGHGLMAGGDWVWFHQLAVELADKIHALGWKAWEVRYQGQSPASLAAALYAATGIYEPWVVLPVHGLLYGLAMAASVDIAIMLGVTRKRAYWVLVPFFFFSTILIYGQIHKDILTLPAFIVLVWALVKGCISPPSNVREFIIFISATIFGMLLAWWGRTYTGNLFLYAFGVTSVPMVLVLLKNKNYKEASFVILFVTTLFLTVGVANHLSMESESVKSESVKSDSVKSESNVTVLQNKIEETISICPTWQPEIKAPIIDRFIGSVICYRHNFIAYHSGNGNIDFDYKIINYKEFLLYFPRAILIGVFSPFPSDWFDKGSSPGGDLKRLFSAIEMLICYIILLGIFLYKNKRILFILVMLTLFFIVFYVYTSPNIGAIYRYRFPYFLVLLIFGIAGWVTYLENKKMEFL